MYSGDSSSDGQTLKIEHDDHISGVKAMLQRRKNPKKTAMALVPPSTAPTVKKRSWSDAEEILILRGIIEYEKEKELRYTYNFDAFYDYFCTQTSIDECFTKNQLLNKVKKLKKRYRDNLAKVPSLTNETEQQLFNLSHIIWAEDVPNVETETADDLRVLEKTREATLLFPSLGEDQEKLMFQKLRNLEAHKRKNLSDEWEVLLVEELQLKIKKQALSKKLSNA